MAPSSGTTAAAARRKKQRTAASRAAAAAGGAKKGGAKVKPSDKSATNVAIATELAPAVAIALLEQTDQPEGAPAAALDCLAAGAAPSETNGKLRVQLLFENGAVLPVEMTTAAGKALAKGLTEELKK